MGITDLSLQRINRYLKPNDSILIIGCQNIFSAENYGQIAHTYFENGGHTVRSLDILGCQGSEPLDLRQPLELGEWDMVLQHGTVEHIDGSLYIPFKNIHNACKVGGVMIHENPATGNWPLHGQHYFTKGFYYELADDCNYGIFEVGEEPAMGNTTDGWNVCAVLKRNSDYEFIMESTFNQIYAEHIRSK